MFRKYIWFSLSEKSQFVSQNIPFCKLHLLPFSKLNYSKHHLKRKFASGNFSRTGIRVVELLFMLLVKRNARTAFLLD